MKKYFISVLLALCSLVPSYGQDKCGKVIDFANVLDGRITDASNVLENNGAEPHFYTDTSLKGFANIDQLELGLEHACPSWTVNGVRKNNLIVYLVITKDHKLGMFYGSAFHKALDDSYGEIQNSYMKPKFRDADFTGGFVAGANRTVAHIKAANMITKGPTTIVNEQPTDLSGLWSFLKWVIFIVIMGTLFYLAYYFVTKRKEKEEARLQAQRKARTSKSLTISAVNNYLLTATTDDQKSIGNAAQARLDEITGSIKYDTESVLEAADYEIICNMYDSIRKSLYIPSVKDPLSSKLDSVNRSSYRFTKTNYTTHSTPPTPSTPTTIVNNYPTPNPYYPPLYTPPIVIVDEPVYVEPYRAPDPEPSYRDSGSGGSDSWSSSDSGSGSSSDFSSSDSGGGGGSDW